MTQTVPMFYKIDSAICNCKYNVFAKLRIEGT